MFQRGLGYLRSLQEADGSWSGLLESDPSVTAQFLLLTHYLDAVLVDEQSRILSYFRATRRSAGGWSAYPGGPVDLDVTVLVYAAMRAAGVPAGDPDLERARRLIFASGGLGQLGVRCRPYLMYLDLIPRKAVPYITSKLIRLPQSFHPNLYDLPVVRLALVPLMILSSADGVRPVPLERSIVELLPSNVSWKFQLDPAHDVSGESRDGNIAESGSTRMRKRLLRGFKHRIAEIHSSFRVVFSLSVIKPLSFLFRIMDRLFPDPQATAIAVDWLLARQEKDGTFGEVSWPTIAALMALDTAGRRREALRGLDGLRSLLVQDGRGSWLRPSPCRTWDTALALRTLTLSGASADDPAVAIAIQWLADHQAKARGDWAFRFSSAVEPGAWYFGQGNENYPDADDTAVVLRALTPYREMIPDTFRRGTLWLLALQDDGGGFASWDKGNRNSFLFSMEALAPGVEDQPDTDITARALMALAPLVGSTLDTDGRIHRAIRKGVSFLRTTREIDGTWIGHWFVNRAYATAQVLESMVGCGISPDEPPLSDCVTWLEKVQNTDGGWGESRQSYFTKNYESAPSNPISTGFIVQSLVAAGRRSSPSVAGALEYLSRTQADDGSWGDPSWNSVAIPGHQYFRYYLLPTTVCLAAVAIAGYRSVQSNR